MVAESSPPASSSAKRPSREPLAAAYSPPANTFDELLTAAGEMRPHWRTFFQHVDAMGPAGLDERWGKARHLLHENGVSYNVYGDPRGIERPWSLSPIPVLLPASEWRGVERGLVQRARLLDALLRDLYGPQRTLTEGLLPPELVFGNSNFLRACHGMAVPNDVWLPIYAADVVRLSNGEFAVLEDRTQIATGAGYALENRIVLSSVLPEAFRESNVERLAHFFRAFRDGLSALAPKNRDNPRIVLLTPGPYNATYFEQAYLAQYLGYTLVNGGDLTVRDAHVYLKTLSGLSPIDVILRRVNDDYSDPLELRSESVLGVPGLVQAARSGNVALASPLGTGLLQTPAILPYLAGLCRVLLGEELRLPSVRTYFCGDPGALGEAVAQFDDVVVKRTFTQGFVQPIFTAHLTKAARAELLEKVRARPSGYVVQERVKNSTAPTLVEGALSPRGLSVRGFAVKKGDTYVVMPGGLARVASGTESSEVSMQLGAGSKDTWILADEAVPTFSLLPPANFPVTLSRGGADLPSRAADNLFWLGRYAERADGIARLARVVCARLADLVAQRDFDSSSEFVLLLATLTAQTSQTRVVAPGAVMAEGLRGATERLVTAVFDGRGANVMPSTMKGVVRSTLRAARLVRDRVSADTWRVLAELDEELLEAESGMARDPIGTMQQALNRVVLRLGAFSGVATDSMTRGQAWRFVDMGRRLERAVNLGALLRGTLVEPCDREGPLLEAVLDIADSGMTYRRRYRATLQAAPVVDLLLTDETNPRSVVFQVDALASHMRALPSLESGIRTPQERIAMRLLTDLQLLDVDRLCAVDAQGRRPHLVAYLNEQSAAVSSLSDSIGDRYLNHATVSRHLALNEALERQNRTPTDGALGLTDGEGERQRRGGKETP